MYRICGLEEDGPVLPALAKFDSVFESLFLITMCFCIPNAQPHSLSVFAERVGLGTMMHAPPVVTRE